MIRRSLLGKLLGRARKNMEIFLPEDLQSNSQDLPPIQDSVSPEAYQERTKKTISIPKEVFDYPSSRDLEDVATEELWEAIRSGAKDLLLISDEIKRRQGDERTKKLLELLGLSDRTGFEPVASVKKATQPHPRVELPRPKPIQEPPEPQDYLDLTEDSEPASEA